jgi:hypothetical protein
VQLIIAVKPFELNERRRALPALARAGESHISISAAGRHQKRHVRQALAHCLHHLKVQIVVASADATVVDIIRHSRRYADRRRRDFFASRSHEQALS